MGENLAEVADVCGSGIEFGAAGQDGLQRGSFFPASAIEHYGYLP
ncbi:hypothetical protein [Streptomyces sp. NPDC001537]